MILSMDKTITKILEWSGNKSQPKGLSGETINKVSEYCVQHFGTNLPLSYRDFLKLMNGFSYDDRSIFCCYNDDIKNNFPGYASLDLVTFNTKFTEYTDIDEYIFLGRSSLDFIAYSKKNNNYVIVDQGDVVHGKHGEYDTFEELILNFFQIK